MKESLLDENKRLSESVQKKMGAQWFQIWF